MKYDEVSLGPRQNPTILPILCASCVFPVSVVFWLFNFFLKFISVENEEDELDGTNTATPTRWFLSIAVSVFLTFYGLRKKSLSPSGAMLALAVGFFLSMSSYCFMTCLLAFFLSSSRATKFRDRQKKKIEEDFKEGGQRNWIQVLCNGGMATELGILYILDVGYGERVINFGNDYRASWLGIGVLGSLACANGDTWASELGTVVKVISDTPRLITSWSQVPKGTNGGVTLGGLLFSFLGGLLVGFVYYVTLLACVDSRILEHSPPQWPIVYIGGIGGLLGSLIDSFLGATMQYSGVDASGKIHEVPGPNIRPISGLCLFDNHSVNLISTILTGLLLPYIGSYYMWR